MKNNNGRVLILVKLQAKACNFTKINTPPWVFFMFFTFFKACSFTKINTPPWMFFTIFKLYKWYQIARRITYEKLFSRKQQEKNQIIDRFPENYDLFYG